VGCAAKDQNDERVPCVREKAPVSGESSLRPRVRGSLAVMLERYCAEHPRCRGGAIGGHGRPESTTEFRSSWPVRGRTWPSFKPNVLPESINRRVSIEVIGQWLFQNAPHSSDTDV